MAGGWNMPPIYGPGTSVAVDLANSRGVQVTSGASNVKGTWTQLVLSTANDISRLVITIDSFASNQPAVTAFDFAVAAGGSEASGVLIQNLLLNAAAQIAQTFELPCIIKAGSRIAARMASSVAADFNFITLLGFDSGFTETISACSYDTYGYSGSGAITGIPVDPGGTTNTKGAYAVITASATNDMAGFFLVFDNTNYSPTVGNDAHTLLDIAIGAAASEVVIVPNIVISRNLYVGGNQLNSNYTPIFWVPIKAGMRIAARSMSPCIATPDRIAGVSLYGVRA